MEADHSRGAMDPVEDFKRSRQAPAPGESVSDWKQWGTDWARIFDELIEKKPSRKKPAES